MSQREAPASLTPPSTQEQPMTDTPMPEAPFTEPASTTDHKTAVTADRADQSPQQQQDPAPEQAPPMTDMPLASTFPREHPPREPTRRQTIPRPYDRNTPPDRKPPHLSSNPSAPDSLPQTPTSGMSAPSAPRARTGTPVDRTPHLSSYPTAPGSAPQTPQRRTSQTSQHGMSPAGWLVPPPANPALKISFEGTF